MIVELGQNLERVSIPKQDIVYNFKGREKRFRSKSASGFQLVIEISLVIIGAIIGNISQRMIFGVMLKV